MVPPSSSPPTFGHRRGISRAARYDTAIPANGSGRGGRGQRKAGSGAGGAAGTLLRAGGKRRPRSFHPPRARPAPPLPPQGPPGTSPPPGTLPPPRGHTPPPRDRPRAFPSPLPLPPRGLPAGAAARSRVPVSRVVPPPCPPHGELPEGGEDRGGHLRRRVQGPEQGHGGGGGTQEDPLGHGDRGRPQHGHPGDLPAQGAQPPQHRQAAGRDPHGEQALPGLRVPAPGPEEVHGFLLHQRHRPAPHQELPVPAAAGPGLLPRAPRAAPRPQAPKLAHQRRRRHQTGRLRPGSRLRGARAHLHPRGGDPLVPSPRDPPGLQVLLDGRRHLELGLHLCGDDHPARSVPWGLGDRPALPHLPHAGNARRGGLARRHRHARLQAQFPQMGPAGFRQSGAAAGRGGTEAAGANAALRPQQADLGQGCAGTPLLPRRHQGRPPPAPLSGPTVSPPDPARTRWDLGMGPAAACCPPRVWSWGGGGVLPAVPPS